MLNYLIFIAGTFVGIAITAFFAGFGAADDLALMDENERLRAELVEAHLAADKPA